MKYQIGNKTQTQDLNIYVGRHQDSLIFLIYFYSIFSEKEQDIDFKVIFFN